MDLNFPIHSLSQPPQQQQNHATKMTSTTTTSSSSITTDHHQSDHHHHKKNICKDLNFPKQTINDCDCDDYDDDDDDDDDCNDDDRITTTTRTTTTLTKMQQQQQENNIADLSDEFKVSKPLKHQSYAVQRSRGNQYTERRALPLHKCCVADSRVQRANRYGSAVAHCINDRDGTNYSGNTNNNIDNVTYVNNSGINITYDDIVDLNLCQQQTSNNNNNNNYWINNSGSNNCSSSHIQCDYLCCNNETCCNSSTTNSGSGSSACMYHFENISSGGDCNSVQVMRLSVPAAAQGGGRHHTSMYVSTPDTAATTNANNVTGNVIENGTVMGAIQPSLTIQINQSPNDYHQSHGGIDHQLSANFKQQQSNVVNHHTSGISIVNCYRAVPVQIVNNSVNSNNCSNNSCSNTIVSDTMVQIVNNNNNNNKVIEKCDNVDEKERNPGDHLIDGIVMANNNDNCVVDSEIIQMDTIRNTMSDNAERRTYTSTEAQTDSLPDQSQAIASVQSQSLRAATAAVAIVADTSVSIENPSEVQMTREQRRRDRRERRLARNARQQHLHPPIALRSGFEILPDILHSHVPPPYTALSISSQQTPPPPSSSSVPSVLVPPIITPLPVVGPTDDGRYSFPLPIIRR